jgi:hypothetical protein
VDYLGTAFTNYIPEDMLALRYPPWQTATIDERYTRYTAAEIIANYRIKAATTWPGLRDFLIYALYDQHAMVVEGYQVEPAFVHELCTMYPQFPIGAVFLIRTQPTVLADDLRRSTDPEDWVLRSATQPVTFERVAQTMCQYSAFVAAEAERWGFPVCEMDGPFATCIDQAVTLLIG